MATRDVSLNGLGLTPPIAESETTRFLALFPLIAEGPAVFPAWQQIVMTYVVIGKQVHDARLVAICHIAGIANILTFNVNDFKRYSQIVTPVNPRAL